jgi:hypothetical protein
MSKVLITQAQRPESHSSELISKSRQACKPPILGVQRKREREEIREAGRKKREEERGGREEEKRRGEREGEGEGEGNWLLDLSRPPRTREMP